MSLRTIAELAAIIAGIIAFLQYADIKPNALDRIPDLYKSAAESDVENVAITIEEKNYSGDKKPLYFQYKAAVSIPDKYSKDAALEKVVSSALRADDLRLSIAAAKEIEEKYSKSNVLEKIVETALSDGDEAGYAVVAAELIPEKYTKSRALDKIVKYYQAQTSPASAQRQLTELEKYKEIFSFADAPAYMSMSSDEAKEFTENWLKTRSYSQFAFFKMVFEFADAPAFLNMSADDAESFAFHFIDNHTEEEFSVYTEAFKFSDAPGGMGLSTEQAMAFAENKVAEFRAENNAANKAPQSTQ